MFIFKINTISCVFFSQGASLWGFELVNFITLHGVLSVWFSLIFTLILKCIRTYPLITSRSKGVKSGVKLGVESANLDFAIQLGKGCHFLLFCRFGIDIHGRFNISVTHDLLNDFDIGFILTEPCTEGVAEVMS